MIKQILSSPQSTPDTVPYILSGLIPIEGQLHIKALTFMYSIFLLPKESTENMIAYRQLYIKNYKSSSWFRERPFNLKGGGGVCFFLKKNILIPNVAEKNHSDFGGGKKNNLIQSFCHKI